MADFDTQRAAIVAALDRAARAAADAAVALDDAAKALVALAGTARAIGAPAVVMGAADLAGKIDARSDLARVLVNTAAAYHATGQVFPTTPADLERVNRAAEALAKQVPS